MSASCEGRVLSGRVSLFEADHSSTEVLPSVVRLAECDREASTIRRPWPTRGFQATQIVCKIHITYSV
jgi:hypothetical protein